jgi:membrane protein CcdC involved in cytochrome C biogenesis
MSPEAISEDFLFTMEARSYVMLALVIILMVGLIKVYGSFYPHQKYDRTKFIARVGIFSAIATILYVVPIFRIHVFFLPSFLELHFDEVPAFIAGFAYGPWAGFAVLVIKTIIKLPFTDTLCVGELSDLTFLNCLCRSSRHHLSKETKFKRSGSWICGFDSSSINCLHSFKYLRDATFLYVCYGLQLRCSFRDVPSR